jgi:hypothetical protein
MDELDNWSRAAIRSAKHFLVDTEEPGEDRTILLVEAPGAPAPDVLLDIGRVASEKAGNRGIVVPLLLDQLVQGFACFVHRRRPK